MPDNYATSGDVPADQVATDLRAAATILDEVGWKPTLPTSTGNFAPGPGLVTNQAVTAAVTGDPQGNPHATVEEHVANGARCRAALTALRAAGMIDHDNVWQRPSLAPSAGLRAVADRLVVPVAAPAPEVLDYDAIAAAGITRPDVAVKQLTTGEWMAETGGLTRPHVLVSFGYDGEDDQGQDWWTGTHYVGGDVADQFSYPSMTQLLDHVARVTRR